MAGTDESARLQCYGNQFRYMGPSSQGYSTESPAATQENSLRGSRNVREANGGREAAEREIRRLKKQLEEMKEREKVATRIVAVPTKNMRKKEIGHQERKSIEQAVNFNVFSKCVFMPDGGPGWAMIMEEVYDTMDPKPNKEDADQASWMLPRGEYVASVFSNTRGYISGQMKKAFGKCA